MFTSCRIVLFWKNSFVLILKRSYYNFHVCFESPINYPTQDHPLDFSSLGWEKSDRKILQKVTHVFHKYKNIIDSLNNYRIIFLILMDFKLNVGRSKWHLEGSTLKFLQENLSKGLSNVVWRSDIASKNVLPIMWGSIICMI